jgi:hypothetical protein
LEIVEVMLNPDDRVAGGLSDAGKRLSAEDGEAHRACRRS